MRPKNRGGNRSQSSNEEEPYEQPPRRSGKGEPKNDVNSKIFECPAPGCGKKYGSRSAFYPHYDSKH